VDVNEENNHVEIACLGMSKRNGKGNWILARSHMANELSTDTERGRGRLVIGR